MPSPEKRIEFHRNPTHFINRMLVNLPSRTLWVCLIYTITSMCDCDPLFAKMRKLYYGLAIHEDQEETRERKAIVINKAIPALQSDTAIDGSRCRKRMRTRRSLDLTCALGSVAPHKRRLTETSVVKLFPEAKSGAEAKVMLAPIYRAVLEFAPRKPVLDYEMLKSLGLKGENGAAVYMHAIQQRQTFSLVPRNALRTSQQGHRGHHSQTGRFRGLRGVLRHTGCRILRQPIHRLLPKQTHRQHHAAKPGVFGLWISLGHKPLRWNSSVLRKLQKIFV
jgi:hypothetical protein